MDSVRARHWGRRTAVGGTVAVAGLVMFAAVAFACTQRIGTFNICKPASKTYSASTCTKITGTTQSGNLGIQLDDPSVNGGTATEFSAKAINFKTKPYQVTFRKPGSSADCHRTTSADTQILTATDGTTQFMGPKFFKKFVMPSVGTGGQARICTQDIPDVVTGQVLNVTVI